MFDHRLQAIFWARPLKMTPDAKLIVNTCALKRLPDAPTRTLDYVLEETHYVNNSPQRPNEDFKF